MVRVLHPVSPSGPQTPSQPLSPWSGAGVRQWGRGCRANYKSLPSLNLSFHPCPGGLTGDGRVGTAGPGCKLLPARRDSREARGCPAPFVPGLGWGAFPSPRAPSLASLGPTLAQGSSRSLTPWVSGAVAWLLGASGPPGPGTLLLTWPGTSPPSVTGPLTLPCPSLSLFPPLWPFTRRAWLGAVPSRRDRQGKAVERPWAQSQIHLLDDLGRVPVPQFLCL